MEKKFHITITDNKSGRVIQEADTCAIIGGYTVDDGSNGMCIVSCNSANLARAVNAAEAAVDAIYQKNPELKLLALMASVGSTIEEKTEKI
jgi:hypothetical protein